MTKTVHELTCDGVRLAVHCDRNNGIPVVFQHGLGGVVDDVATVFPPGASFERWTLECRGHGLSAPGDSAHFSIPTFTEDVVAMIKHFDLGPVILGGISMGAAISLRLAIVYPELVRGLVLARPAWFADPAPDHLNFITQVGELLAKLPARQAHEAFLQTPTAKLLAEQAPSNLESLEGFFASPAPEITAELLTRIAADGPAVSEKQISQLDIPVLVIGTSADLIHPFDLAQQFKDTIPKAEIVEITAKSKDEEAHARDFQLVVNKYLTRFL